MSLPHPRIDVADCQDLAYESLVKSQGKVTDDDVQSLAAALAATIREWFDDRIGEDITAPATQAI